MFIYQEASFRNSKHWVNFSNNQEFETYIGLLISFMVCVIRFNWKMMLIMLSIALELKKKKSDNNFLTCQHRAKLEKKYLTHFYI